MKPYATWKYVLLVLVIAFGAIYSAPNFYGDDPAVQISRESGDPMAEGFAAQVQTALAAESIQPLANGYENQQYLVRFTDTETQLKAADVLKRELGRGYVIAYQMASKTPAWLRSLGAKPMNLGLDLRGGVHFLIEVDVEEVKKKAVERMATDLPAALRKANIKYTGRRSQGDAFVLEFADADRLDAARKELASDFRELTLVTPPDAPLTLQARISDDEAKRIADFAIQQNLITLRTRIDALGVAEPIVQRQGFNRIVVQLPGVQDPTKAKEILKSTATLEYRAVPEGDAMSAAASGILPPDTELFYHRETRQPVLVVRQAIATGDQIVDASATVDENGSPAVSVRLNGAGGKRMLDFTTKSVGKPMAVLYKERITEINKNAKGEELRETREVKEIISVATIRGVFSNQFQTTGLESREAQNLALLLKAGALAAPVAIVEERTVGPSLGADNIRKGFAAAALGLALVALFMVVYYKVFGLFAVAALVLNLLVVIAVLSTFQATLTMPGIAGIVLHMGIAVDANVLIYERIREELRNGLKPHQAIEAGYDRAFLTIADANVTVLIGTVVLFALGAGPVKGFAITLAVGIMTSQFTAIVGSRALAQLAFARRPLKDVPVW